LKENTSLPTDQPIPTYYNQQKTLPKAKKEFPELDSCSLSSSANYNSQIGRCLELFPKQRVWLSSLQEYLDK